MEMLIGKSVDYHSPRNANLQTCRKPPFRRKASLRTRRKLQFAGMQVFGRIGSFNLQECKPSDASEASIRRNVSLRTLRKPPFRRFSGLRTLRKTSFRRIATLRTRRKTSFLRFASLRTLRKTPFRRFASLRTRRKTSFRRFESFRACRKHQFAGKQVCGHVGRQSRMGFVIPSLRFVSYRMP